MRCRQCGVMPITDAHFCETSDYRNAKKQQRKYVGNLWLWLVVAMVFGAIMLTAFEAKAEHEPFAVMNAFDSHRMVACNTQLELRSLLIAYKEQGVDAAEELRTAMVDEDGEPTCGVMNIITAITKVVDTYEFEGQTFYIIKLIVIGEATPYPPFTDFWLKPSIQFGYTSSRPVTYNEYKDHLANPIEEMEADGT